MNINIKKIKKSSSQKPALSVLIPSWNNLEYLKLCLKSLQMNSSFNNQIIVIINDGSDGTLEWVDKQEIDYLNSYSNVGICYALNSARSLVEADYIVYLNDDMYMLPEWDKIIIDEINSIGHDSFMLSSTMIEPNNTNNPCVISMNFGDSPTNFKENELLDKFRQILFADWSGSTWPPVVVNVNTWDLVGGLSTEFSPGMYSDPDFAMKLWKAGVRYFKGLGNSRCYHFGSKSTKRIVRNNGRRTFIRKWGISSKFFTQKYLHSGEPFSGILQEPKFSFPDKLNILLKSTFSA